MYIYIYIYINIAKSLRLNTESLSQPSTDGLEEYNLPPSKDGKERGSSPSSYPTAITGEKVEKGARKTGSGKGDGDGRLLRTSDERKLVGKEKEEEKVKEKEKEKEKENDIIYKETMPVQINDTPLMIPLPNTDDPDTSVDFLFVVLTFERMVLCGTLVCLDSVLFVLTTMPLRFFLAFATVLQFHLGLRARAVSVMQKLDLASGMLLFTTSVLLYYVDVDLFLQFLEQGLFKLRALVILLEVLDNVLASYGTNIFRNLFWKIKVSTESLSSQLGTFLAAEVYLTIHTVFVLLHCCVIMIAVRQDTTLLSLILLIQFRELKSGLNKKDFDSKKLRKLSYVDIYKVCDASVG